MRTLLFVVNEPSDRHHVTTKNKREEGGVRERWGGGEVEETETKRHIYNEGLECSERECYGGEPTERE